MNKMGFSQFVCKMLKLWKCKILLKIYFSKTRGILLWKSVESGKLRHTLIGFSGLICTVHPVIFNWQRVFLLLSFLFFLFFFCISRRKLYSITFPKVIFYSKNHCQGKENKAQLCLSLLMPADTDTSSTLGWNHTRSNLHEHTFLYLLRFISRLVSRWSYSFKNCH